MQVLINACIKFSFTQQKMCNETAIWDEPNEKYPKELPLMRILTEIVKK